MEDSGKRNHLWAFMIIGLLTILTMALARSGSTPANCSSVRSGRVRVTGRRGPGNFGGRPPGCFPGGAAAGVRVLFIRAVPAGCRSSCGGEYRVPTS